MKKAKQSPETAAADTAASSAPKVDSNGQPTALTDFMNHPDMAAIPQSTAITPLIQREPASEAAFFDLDKTILARSANLMFMRPFFRSGLLGRADVLRGAYAQFVYLASGADHDQMEQMRAYLTKLSTGWEVETVQQIVRETLDELVDPTIYEEASALIDRHHAAGRDVIIISSSGTEIVEPIGERLGVDYVIGTQLNIVDGRYTGEILWYTYADNKARAMQALAEEKGYDLTQSYAYSDSHTDLPMLETVGHPIAVNPDDPLRQIAQQRDWPILDFAKPMAMQARRRKHVGMAAGAAGATIGVGAVALGLTWYLSRKRRS